MPIKILYFFLLLGIAIRGNVGSVKAQPLAPYACLTDFYDTNLWLKDANRKPDARGILTQNSKYHALSISFLGIMRYEDYLRTGDTTCKSQMLAQYKFFCDTSMIIINDSGRGMGLPYRESYKDMKAPWFSGMTQGAGLSFLARYYDLTHDKSALEKMQQLVHLMLKPENKGGTIGLTAEGRTWIEEYPNSSNSPQVLNGFINGLIGLHDYLLLFPNDTSARRVHDSSYYALSKTVGYYDSNSWSDYMRTRNHALTNSYMQYQLAEMAHLYMLYKDEQWLRQLMIWAQMAYTKPDTQTKCYRKKGYFFGVPIDPIAVIHLASDTAFANVMKPLSGKNAITGAGAHNFPAQPMLLKRRKAVQLNLEPETYQVVVTFNRPDLTDKVKFSCRNRQGVESPVKVSWNRFTATLRMPEAAGKIEINCKSKPPLGAAINEITVPDLDKFVIPKIGFYRVPANISMVEGKHYRIDFLAQNVVGAKLFYRHDSPKVPLNQAVWNKDQYLELPHDTFLVATTAKYEFLLAFPIKQSEPKLEKMDLKVLD